MLLRRHKVNTDLSHKSDCEIADCEIADGFNGAVVKSSGNRLVGTGFASGYRLQPRAGF